MKSRWGAGLVLVVVGGILAACSGGAAETTPGTSDAPRAIEMTMTDDLRFSPDPVTVAAGETIRFVVINPTALEHVFVIGDEEEQEHHAEDMMSGGMMHDEDNAISVSAGETKELVYTFHEPGELLIGCHVQGHYEAGMIGHIIVE